MNHNAESAFTGAAITALESFPIEVERIALVAQSENVTFRVSAKGSKTDYVLRLHRPGYCSIEELESERVWIAALQGSGVAIQDSLKTHQGKYYVLVDMPDLHEQRYAGMTTWHDGIPLREFLESCRDKTERQRVFEKFGGIAAVFHNQSTSWQPPSDFTRRRLDLDGLLGEQPFWGRFWEHPDFTTNERDLLLRARASVREALFEFGENSDSFSLIHADFTPDNIIYNDGELAVIDFDDSAFGWHLYDIASALVECCFESDYELLRAAFLTGYRSERSLSGSDEKLLAEFLIVRGMAIIGWYHQRPEYAGAAYFKKFKDWVVENCESRGY